MNIKRQNKIKTEWGTASIYKSGYYVITSRKEGNNNKYLHRLIFEKYFGKIPNGWVVHHKDGNKLNNCIFNLQLMREREHNKLHNKGKIMPKCVKNKIRESMKGEKSPLYKKEARVVKKGMVKGKQNYGLIYEGEIIQRSIFKDKLEAEAERLNK